MKTIDIITDTDYLPEPKKNQIGQQNVVGFLLECPSDCYLAQSYQTVFFSDTLLGDSDLHKKCASDFLNQLLRNEPLFEDVPQLLIYKETIITKLTLLFQLSHLHDFLVKKGFSRAVFFVNSSTTSLFSCICKKRGHLLDVVSPPQRAKYKSLRRVKYISLVLNNKTEWILYFNLFLNQLDPFHKRTLCINFFRKRKNYARNQAWFLSFAKNYTEIGLFYESLFPKEFCFIVEDKLTGGFPLKKKKRPFVDLYEFGKLALIPTKKSILAAEKKIRDHVNIIELNHHESMIRELWLADEWTRFFFKSLLPIGLYLTQLAHAWINQVKPSALIVGNNGHEQYGLWIAKKKHIPTVLLQHGVLGDYYQFVDWPVDHYIVRGQFWRDFLMKSARDRAYVINPPTDKNYPYTNNLAKPYFVYFSLFYPDIEKKTRFCEERDSQLLAIAEAAIASNSGLVIRFHPRDCIERHKKYIQLLYKKNGIILPVYYSHTENVRTLLKSASAAVMYFSTVFLDCLSLNIPIITYDWLNFPHKKHIKKYQLFYFARNLMELKFLITKAIRCELVASPVNKKLFLDETEIIMAKQFLKKLVWHPLVEELMTAQN